MGVLKPRDEMIANDPLKVEVRIDRKRVIGAVKSSLRLSARLERRPKRGVEEPRMVMSTY
jgi:hypothetical protein